MQPILTIAAFWRSLSPRIHRALFALAIIGVTAATLFPVPAPPPSHWFQIDKLLHFLSWGGLAFLAYPLTDRAWPAFGLVGLHGALIELIQIPVPGRSGEVLDLVADLLGAAVGVMVSRWLWRRGASEDSAIRGK